jgi:hypothetical protein
VGQASRLPEGSGLTMEESELTVKLSERMACEVHGDASTHLTVARMRGYVPDDTASALRNDAAQVVRMLDGLISYLLRSDRRHRR